MATNRNSGLYLSAYINKYLADARDVDGRMFVRSFKHTIVSGETGGASAGVQDSINLCVLPANCTVVGLFVSAEALWASPGVNGTLQIGDSGDLARYLLATEFYTAAGGPLGTDVKQVGLAFAGQNYRPTADTIVLATYKVANPTVGKTFRGGFVLSAQE